MVSKTVRNKKLYDYIVKNYIKSDDPMTQQEIADKFYMSLGTIKNFMYRHDLNKKSYYRSLEKMVLALKKADVKPKVIAKKMGISNQYVYYFINKEREKNV